MSRNPKQADLEKDPCSHSTRDVQRRWDRIGALRKLNDLPAFQESILATSQCPKGRKLNPPKAKELRPGFVETPGTYEVQNQYLRHKRDFKIGMKVEHEHAGECVVKKLIQLPNDPKNLLVEVEYKIWLCAEGKTETMRQQYFMFYYSDSLVGDWHSFGYSFKPLKRRGSDE